MFEHIPTNGITLHTALAGPPDGPPVVLLHGFPEYWRGWLPQIQALAGEGFRVIAPDQRGYNLSDKPAEMSAYDVSELARDVVGLADALGYERVHLAGHDWGAVVAWVVAAKFPERLHSLTIANVPHPAVYSRTVRRSPEQFLRSWYVVFFQLKPLTEWLLSRGDFAGLLTMMRRSSKPDTFTAEDFDAYREAWAQPGALTGMLNWYRAAFRRFTARDRGAFGRVEPITVPTLMLWGKRDVALSHKMAEPSIALCQQGRLRFFEEATHWVQHDEAAAVSAELIAHIRSV
jgi:pimeloyl-ACP methyl ester carboxylesterase